MPLLDVSRSVGRLPSGRARKRRSQGRLVLDRTGQTRGAGRRIRIGQIRHGALSVLKLLPYPTAHRIRKGASVQRQDLLGPTRRSFAGPRQRHLDDLSGADDVAQSAAHHRAADRRDRSDLHRGLAVRRRGSARIELLTQVGIPIRRAACQLSAPALRRAAPARDDRHGAGERAGSADRGRADHRARRHRAGADPEAAARRLQPRLGMAMLFITHDLGIVRRMADTVCVMTTARSSSSGPVEQVFTAAPTSYTRRCWRQSRSPIPRRHGPMHRW
jgi:microcin C transport system ATP-binding protein